MYNEPSIKELGCKWALLVGKSLDKNDVIDEIYMRIAILEEVQDYFRCGKHLYHLHLPVYTM